MPPPRSSPKLVTAAPDPGGAIADASPEGNLVMTGLSPLDLLEFGFRVAASLAAENGQGGGIRRGTIIARALIAGGHGRSVAEISNNERCRGHNEVFPTRQKRCEQGNRATSG